MSALIKDAERERKAVFHQPPVCEDKNNTYVKKIVSQDRASKSVYTLTERNNER